MVVGSGETGADIAYLAVTTPGVERVVLCHRDGVHFAPKVSKKVAALKSLSDTTSEKRWADIISNTWP